MYLRYYVKYDNIPFLMDYTIFLFNDLFSLAFRLNKSH